MRLPYLIAPKPEKAKIKDYFASLGLDQEPQISYYFVVKQKRRKRK